MDNQDHHGQSHHPENPQVCFTVGLIFIGVLAAIFLLAIFN